MGAGSSHDDPRPGGDAEHRAAVSAELEAASTDVIRSMVLASGHLTELAGGVDAVDRMLESIENVWIDVSGLGIHLDLHRSDDPRATIVFQPGSGSHARFYFLAAAMLAQRGYHVLAVDRPGHGLSEGPRGDCTIEEAITVASAVIAHARSQWPIPVVLMGSSLGGLLTVFGLLRGLEPDLAVAHNFAYLGKLASMRMRAGWIRRFRTRPYPLTKLVHDLEELSEDPAVSDYLRRRDDPGAAWELSARSVADLLSYRSPRPAPGRTPPCLVVTGDRDKAVPAWATRLFTRWSRLPSAKVMVVPDAGHLLFLDDLDRSLPAVADWIDARLSSSE